MWQPGHQCDSDIGHDNISETVMRQCENKMTTRLGQCDNTDIVTIVSNVIVWQQSDWHVTKSRQSVSNATVQCLQYCNNNITPRWQCHDKVTAEWQQTDENVTLSRQCHMRDNVIIYNATVGLSYGNGIAMT